MSQFKQFGWGAIALALALAASAAHAADKPAAVTVSLGDVSINKVPFLIAADAGIYAKYGLTVHQFITPGAADVARASGVNVPKEYVSAASDAEVSIGGGSPSIYRMVTTPAGVDRVIVSTTEVIARDHIIARDGVASLQDLKGKRLGFSGTGTVTNLAAISLVRKMGWKPSDVTMVARANSLEALKADKVDAFVGSVMKSAMVPGSGFHDIADLATLKLPLAGSGVMFDKKWLAGNRDTAMNFVKATIAATALMKSDRKVFDAALVKWFNIKDAQTQNAMFAATKEIPAKPYPSVDGIKAVIAAYDIPEMKKHKAEDFYDSSFIAELDKSGFLDHPLK